MQYKILFVGLGSIGQRHLKNLTTILNSRNTNFQIDALRMQNSTHIGVGKIYTYRDDIPDDYDIIFITNPTNLHYETMMRLKDKTKHFFVEKPIFDKIHKFSFNNGVCYVACPLRFHPIIGKLKDFAQNNNVFSFRAICSSYLPDWRANIDYKSNYSAKKSMGGGVELDLIHEVDYLKWIFGKPKKVSMFLGKKSNLEIDSNDVSLYLFEFSNSIGSLHLDYFGRYQQKTKREIEIYTNDDTILFDITNCSIRSSKTGINDCFPSEDMHMNEMKYFFEKILDNTESKTYHNFPKEALESLKIALRGNTV
ncbi:MAG: Gfo/Idh/MocA family oxidoreductase [Holosporaceae bacterium]|nr:Gfo/Idh/MocA family oxidoreductase [Holosporaceae bacterium]